MLLVDTPEGKEHRYVRQIIGTIPTLDKQRQGKGSFNSLPELDIETSVELKGEEPQT